MGSLTRYFPGGAETLVANSPVAVPSLAMPTATPGSGGVPGLPDFSGILAQRAKIEAEREARAAQLQRLQIAAMRQGMAGDAADRRFSENERFNAALGAQGDRAFQGKVQDIQLRGMLADEQAQSAPPPLRMVSGPGYMPGYTMDTLRMNSRQRQAFLPTHSANDAYRDSAASGMKKKEEDDDWNAFLNDSARRNEISAKGGY